MFHPGVARSLLPPFFAFLPLQKTMSRAVMFVSLGCLKRYPKTGQFESLCPRGVVLGDRQTRELVRRGILHLATVMAEVSVDHLLHPSNGIPHFPFYCLGSVDTVSIDVETE